MVHSMNILLFFVVAVIAAADDDDDVIAFVLSFFNTHANLCIA